MAVFAGAFLIGPDALANCDRDIAAYNALADAYGTKLEEHEALQNDQVRQCAVGREIKPLLEQMKSAGDKIRKCRIKGGMESPRYYDGMIGLAEFVFEDGCPGEGMEKCPQYVSDIGEQIEQLFEPYAKDVSADASDSALCEQSKELDKLIPKADQAVSAIKTKCSVYLEGDEDDLTLADALLFELTERSLNLHRSTAELYRSKCW